MSGQKPRHEILESETMVDSDVHLSIPMEDLFPYLDPPYPDRIRYTDHGAAPEDGWDRTLGGKIRSTKKYSLRENHTAETIEEDLCRDLHVDYPIINTFGGMSMRPEPDFAVALMRAHNDLLLDQFLDAYDHFKGLVTLTTQKPDRAAEELDRLSGEDDIVGAYIHNTGPHPPLGDPTYDIVWEAAEDNDLNVAFHGSANGFMYEFPRQNQALNQFLAVHSLAHPWSQELTLTSLLVEGVPEKFPDLEFAFLEAGVTWPLHLMFRLNKEYSIRRSEAPLLEHSPEHYIRENMYFASQPIGEPENPDHMSQIFDILGTDSMLFATDYPHWDFDNPEALDRHLRSAFSQAEREQVLAGNAIDLWDLDI